MVFEDVKAMIAKQLKADPATITRETRLVEDLKADTPLYGQTVKKQITVYFPEVKLTKYLNQKAEDQLACYVRDFQLTLIKNLKNYRFGDY